MSSSQVAKTEVLNCAVGYYMAHDPCPMMMVQPILDMAEAWSKDRLSPMIRDMACLRELVSTGRTRDSSDTVLHKKFAGGHLTAAGANSPASLASRPIRVLFEDEIDRYPRSAGGEGDPGRLVERRTQNFWNRKIVRTSTPVDEATSRIEPSYQNSDQRVFRVPCLHCEEAQELKWSNVLWPKSDNPEAEGMERHLYEDATYVCQACGGEMSDVELKRQVSKGHWYAKAPFRGHAGFYINALYSPWTTLARIVKEFLECKSDPDLFKTWINTVLGQSWKETLESMDNDALYNRRENYAAPVPMMACLLTQAVDVQDDRFEIEVIGWGAGEESWNIDYLVLWGDPGTPEMWARLETQLSATYPHESGVEMPIWGTTIDSGGHHTDDVYKFCAPRYNQRVFAVKGFGGADKPIVGSPTRRNSYSCRLYPVGSDTSKDWLFSRLQLEEPGPGYCHFPVARDRVYFDGLTAEEAKTKYSYGVPYRSWQKKHKGKPNEPLDCRCYNLACLRILGVNLEIIAAQWEARIKVLRTHGRMATPADPRERGVRSPGVTYADVMGG